MSRDMRFPTMWYVQPAKPQTSLCICAVDSEPLLVAEYSLSAKLLVKHHLEFLSLNGGCTGSSESALVKMPHCWKSHVAARILRHPFIIDCVYKLNNGAEPRNYPMCAKRSLCAYHGYRLTIFTEGPTVAKFKI